MAYWLMKSEPDVFGIDDLKRVGIEPWDGVRNYQARNMLRDQMQVDDLAFFYHSNCKIPGIAGIMAIHRAGYPDPTAFDSKHPYYDPKSKPENPRWYLVDVAFVARFSEVIPLSWLKDQPELADLPLVRRGNRLSIMPLSDAHWHFINRHAQRV
ncbi:MAG: EVE domain-containing protein [Desulfobulbaceae bacterium]|nr:EVE domain-containing protein [Desulfobulbaceae bacterium]